MYDGEWCDDKLNGKGISYFENGEIEHDGEWIDNNIVVYQVSES